MFVRLAKLVTVLTEHKTEIARYLIEIAGVRGECKRLEIENARLRSDMDWFKIRLNAVEKERAQLIHAAIGVKLAIPEFVPTGDKTADALQELPDLSRVGGDAADEDNGRALIPGQTDNPDYSLLPGYEKTR